MASITTTNGINGTSTDSHPRATLPVPNPSKSFWHSQPSTALLGHRTTPDLPPTVDTIIIGTGITGSSAARHLALHPSHAGKSILVLEAREACWAATGRNGGHCQPLLFDRTPDVGAFELRNVAAVSAYIAEHDVACEWRQASGCRGFWDAEMFAGVRAEVEELQRDYPEMGERVALVTDPTELKALRLGEGVVGATVTRGAASLWPYKLVASILEGLIRDGKINLQTNTPVTGIECISDGDNAEGQKRCVVHTPRGSVSARTVILATNGYTSYLLSSFADLIVPIRGEMSALLPPPGASRLPNSYGFTGVAGQPAHWDDYLIQRPLDDPAVPDSRGQLMFGGGRGAANLPVIGVCDDSPVDEGAAAYLRKSITRSLRLDGESKGVAELQATHQWTGIMGFSRDSHPWVGAVPGREGVFVSAGYSGHGMPNGTLCGRAAVEMAVAEAEGRDPAAVAEGLVAEGLLPKAYLLTEERIRKAREMDTVAVQDRDGTFGKSEWKRKKPEGRVPQGRLV